MSTAGLYPQHIETHLPGFIETLRDLECQSK